MSDDIGLSKVVTLKWIIPLLCTYYEIISDTAMADQNLSELLTEFQNLAESEHHAYIDTIVSTHDNASTIFAALSFFEVSKNTLFKNKCKMFHL